MIEHLEHHHLNECNFIEFITMHAILILINVVLHGLSFILERKRQLRKVKN